MQEEALSLYQDKDLHIQRAPPISKLPRDLLHDLFVLLAESWPLKVWFPVNLVCQTWREVAVGTPSLWREPPTHHHDLTLLMLERSKMADLAISLGKKTSAATTEAIMGHVGRIRSLSIMQPPSLLATSCTILQNLIHQASRLEEIAIKCKEGRGGHDPIVSVTSMTFSELPRLRKIDFYNIDFTWNTLLIPRLTKLALIDARSSSRITTPAFLEGLARLPHLETLQISSHIFSASEVFPSSLQDITLPNLSSVYIEPTSMSQLAAILSHMVLPRLHSLRINIGMLTDHHPPWIPALFSTITRGDFEMCNTLVMDDCHLRLIMPRDNTIHTSPGLHLILPPIIRHGAPIVRAVLDNFDVPLRLRITELILGARRRSNPMNTMVQAIINRCPHLKSISVPNSQIPILVEMIFQDPNPLRNLANITLCDFGDPCGTFLRSLHVKGSFVRIPGYIINIHERLPEPNVEVVSAFNRLGVELRRVAMMEE